MAYNSIAESHGKQSFPNWRHLSHISLSSDLMHCIQSQSPLSMVRRCIQVSYRSRRPNTSTVTRLALDAGVAHPSADQTKGTILDVWGNFIIRLATCQGNRGLKVHWRPPWGDVQRTNKWKWKGILFQKSASRPLWPADAAITYALAAGNIGFWWIKNAWTADLPFTSIAPDKFGLSCETLPQDCRPSTRITSFTGILNLPIVPPPSHSPSSKMSVLYSCEQGVWKIADFGFSRE